MHKQYFDVRAVFPKGSFIDYSNQRVKAVTFEQAVKHVMQKISTFDMQTRATVRLVRVERI
jgi:hypothetical protein